MNKRDPRRVSFEAQADRLVLEWQENDGGPCVDILPKLARRIVHAMKTAYECGKFDGFTDAYAARSAVSPMSHRRREMEAQRQ